MSIISNRWWRYIGVVMCLLVLQASAAPGQNYPMLHYGLEHGLPSNRIYDIYRDSHGFLWLATDKGVARYNGIMFEKFTTFNGLSDNEVFFFREDNFGRIWMGTYNGELCFYKDGTFHNAANTPYLRLPFKPYFIYSINIESDSSVSVCFMGQSHFINIKNNKCNVYDLNNAYNISYCSKYLKDHPTETWEKYFYGGIYNVGKTKGGGFKLSGKRKDFYVDGNAHITGIDFTDSMHTHFYFISQDKQYISDLDNLYSLTSDTVVRYKNSLYARLLSNPRIHRFYLSGKDFFVASDTGLIINDTTFLLRGMNVTSVNQDVSGNYWVSTLSDGLYYMDRNMPLTAYADAQYTGNVRYSCVRKNNVFYVNSSNNLYHFKDNKSTCLFSYEKRYSDVNANYPTQPGYYLNDDLKYYFFYYLRNCVVENVMAKNLDVKVYKIYFLRDNIKATFGIGNTLYFQNRSEIIKMDYSNKREGEQIDQHYTDINYNVKNSRIFAAAQSANNDIWYAARDSMYRIVNDSSIAQPQLGNISFRSFVFAGNYLVGYSQNNKLFLCNNYEGSAAIDSITDQNCIWDKIYKIDNSHILVSTNNYYRMITLVPSAGRPQYQVLTIENPIVPLLSESVCADSTNCYFFKNGSITTIATSVLLQGAETPSLSFTSILIDSKAIPVHDVFSIPYDKAGNITLRFATVAFGSRELSYQYTISRSGNDVWNNINGEEINLANATYGDYTIKVRAKTLSGGYSAPAIFTLHVGRPYWATWWFITIVTLGIAGIVALVSRWRIVRIIKKREQEHESQVKFMRSEYKALNALMNPHFIFNTLNNVQSLFNGDNKLAANEYLRIFADLIRQNMQNVSKELITLQKEMDLVKNYLLLEQLRFEDKLKYSITIDPELELYEIMVPPLLIQPLVENAIKHGILPLTTGDGFIQLVLSEENGTLKIIVKDNGVGMNNAQAAPGSLHESFGLDNIRKRIEHLSIIQGKTITFEMLETTDAEGINWTTVVVSMQL